MNRKDDKLKQDRRTAEWESPTSILYRWKNDPNPCEILENSNQEEQRIIRIKKIQDVDTYMDNRFGSDSKNE